MQVSVRVPLWLAVVLSASSFAAQPPHLAISTESGQPQVSLSRSGIAPVAGTRYRLRLEASTDLRQWEDLGEWEGQGRAALAADPPAGEQRFFRLAGTIEGTGEPAEGADVFGYSAILAEELERIGFLTPAAFAAAQPVFPYLELLTFDPREALYWAEFAADPAEVNAGLSPFAPGFRLYDFRLNEAELEVFLRNGFVVSDRLGTQVYVPEEGDGDGDGDEGEGGGAPWGVPGELGSKPSSFGDAYYRIFSDDLPVFVTADSVLHAWHFTYQRLLEEAEELQLAPALGEVLAALRAELAGLPPAVVTGPLRESVLDADYYLTVAASLLAGLPLPSALEQETSVTQTLGAVAARQFVPFFPLFGSERPMDFSQFTVRGHYERSEGLGRYFQSLMWLGRVDFRILQPDAGLAAQSRRELGAALVLGELLVRSGQTARWGSLEDLIRLFVGRQDAMTLPQLLELRLAAGLGPLEEFSSLEVLGDLQQRIRTGGLGVQLYAGDAYFSPLGPEPAQLPAAFALLGQRFVPDGWAIEKTTFDRVFWPETIPGVTWEDTGKVLRRYTSALDVAYSVLGNRQVGGLIADRMLDTSGIGGFRDGYPYAHQLAAVTATLDRLESAAWEDSLYMYWLGALRALSGPTTGPEFPEAMRTRAWSRRTLNTQLASYTELKHDTVLYAKQPYSSMVICEYPAGYVEPIPEFWLRMAALADAAATGLAALPVSGQIEVVTDLPWPVVVDLGLRHEARLAHCRLFADTMRTLAALAGKHLRQEPYTAEDLAFLRGLMNSQDHEYLGPTYDGWYPNLFYKDYGQLLGNTDTAPCNLPDPLVTDIHTAPPDLVDPTGGVLHLATGNVDLLLIAVDNGPDRMVYAGPALSFYEFMVPGPELKRLSDSEWQLREHDTETGWPERPEWTRPFFVPSR